MDSSISRPLTIDRKTLSIEEWLKINGISTGLFRTRISRGWPLKRAVTTKPMIQNNIVEIGGEKRKMSEWCCIYGIPCNTARMRVLRGWKPKEAILTPVGFNTRMTEELSCLD